MADNFTDIVEGVLDSHGPAITKALRNEVRQVTKRKSGKLRRGFEHAIMHDNFGFPFGIKFGMPRYGYILHHGVESQDISDPKQNRVYHTQGIRKTNYISAALDGVAEKIADEVTEKGMSLTSKIFRY